MKRRTFITLVVGAVASPFVGRTQQPAKMKRIAMVHPATKAADLRTGLDPAWTSFFEELKRLGYVEGGNLIVDRYSAEGRYDRFPEIAREVVATRPDVIFATGNALVLAFHSETRTIPVVAWASDPVAMGIVNSLARPGGNITGLSVDAGPELYAKTAELLVKAVGKLSNPRLLVSGNFSQGILEAIRVAVERMNVPYRVEQLRSPINEAEYKRAFDEMQRDHVDGVIIAPLVDNYTHRTLLGRFSRLYRIPSISNFSDTTDAGALMSYSFDIKAEARRIAAQIAEILNGGNPAEMPYFRESHLELVINLNAAKELGLDIPDGLLAIADRVIE